MDWIVGSAAVAARVALAIGGTIVPSTPYCVCGTEFLHFFAKKVCSLFPLRLFVAGARRLFGLVPAGQGTLRRSAYCAFHMSRTRAMWSASSSRSRKERGSSLLKEAQMVGPLVAARVPQRVDRVAGVGLSCVVVFPCSGSYRPNH